MAWSMFTDYHTGEIDFDTISLFNQRIWDNYPEKAREAAIDAIAEGGFGEDCLRRRVGNYEGQVFAVRWGWVEQGKDWYGYKITEKGLAALRDAGREWYAVLPVLDGWHSSTASYRVYEKRRGDEKYLMVATKVCGYQGALAMDPLLSVSDAIALRDCLDKWISETAPAEVRDNGQG